MPEITLYTVPNCADGLAVKRLLSRGAAFTEKDVWGDPQALAEMRARAKVRVAPVTLTGGQAFCGPFGDQRPRILAALRGGAAS